MRILVCSDSHQEVKKFRQIIEMKQAKANCLAFLGDGAYDLERVRPQGMEVHAVAGNCDGSYSGNPVTDVFTVGGKRIFMCHGFGRFAVKMCGISLLQEEASVSRADIVLFGHTHEPLHIYEDGVYFFNPGAVCDGKYGFIDITSAGIVCVHHALPW
ncbi:MAG: YfcE family phosphodiesterase [Oscillospiraceae bacterium]|jgi:putative phosphoesterase|nr:YfcE family phosphodiesterase [Oscillospiraceae bacterium]